MKDLRFGGAVAVVTGGVSGIGRAVVQRLVAEGARVVVLDRNEALWPDLQQRLGSTADHASFVQADLADEPSVAAAASQVLHDHERIDVLVHAAGLVHIDGRQSNPLLERGTQGWDLLTNVNLRAPAALTIALHPGLARARGAVVTVSSEGQFGARDSRWIYDATKAGVLSVTRSMAAAFAADGIRVNAVAPGGTLTEMHLDELRDDPDATALLEATELPNLMRRFARPEEIAAVICFLASDDASFMTGATVPVDGGGRGM